MRRSYLKTLPEARQYLETYNKWPTMNELQQYRSGMRFHEVNFSYQDVLQLRRSTAPALVSFRDKWFD